MESTLALVSHWLPFIQALGAAFSVGGAILSWRFALKAKREREQMTKNLIAAALLEKLEAALLHITRIQRESLSGDGLPDAKIYRAKQQEIKHLFEAISSSALAAKPYLKKSDAEWKGLTLSLSEAAHLATSGSVETASKQIRHHAEVIRLAITARQLQPGE